VFVIVCLTMDSEAAGSGDCSDEQRVNTSEADGCGFSALFKRKHKKNATDDGEAQPPVEKDGTSMATAAGFSSAPEDQSLEESSATHCIPEYVLFDVLWPYTYTVVVLVVIMVVFVAVASILGCTLAVEGLICRGS